MAAKEQVWNIEVEGIPYKIEYKKNKISVNGKEPVKLGKLQKKTGTWETHYTVPLEEGKAAVLHISQFGAPVLSYNDKDCRTGEAYAPMKIPAWGWIFVVLHAINFFLLIGGALGGVLQIFLITLTASVSANRSKKTGARVAACVAIWLVATIVEFILAMWLASALY